MKSCVIVHLKYHIHDLGLLLRSTLSPERGCDLCLELFVMVELSLVFPIYFGQNKHTSTSIKCLAFLENNICNHTNMIEPFWKLFHCFSPSNQTSKLAPTPGLMNTHSTASILTGPHEINKIHTLYRAMTQNKYLQH